MSDTSFRRLFLKTLLGYLVVGPLPMALVTALCLFISPRNPVVVQTAIVLLVIVTLFSIILSWRNSAKLNQSIKGLQSLLDEIDSGNFNIPLASPNSKELTQLFSTIATLAAKISRTKKELQEKDELLQILLNSIPDGLLLLDKNGKILIASPGFKTLFDAEDPEGRFYWEFLREPKLAEVLSKENLQETPCTIEMEREGKNLLVTVSPFTNSGNRLAIFRDISEIVRAGKMKKDLLANLSHELRTPLTAIKGYAETMEETADESVRHYLNVIKRHTERLINLASDLLTLARLEAEGNKRNEEIVNIKEIVANVAAIFRHSAEKKGLKLVTIVPTELLELKGDSLQIEEALINLVDNAIKYTEKGSVTIAVNTSQDEVIISVVDTGIGIEKHHLPNIFERFYVVDRSRSRATGGTGLGLAIVKHIVDLHKGKIKVESSPGAGTKFTISIPIRG
ncbi:MAG: ATP-binding protein [candidate division WOR-3 bacterium]